MTTTTGYVNSNGMRLWYEGRGQPEGAPVVLVMGVDASSIWWPRALVERLVQAGLRVVRFDNRDIGLSTHLPPDGPPYGLADMASDTRGLLDALGIRRAHLVGMSLGGMIGQWLAIHDGDRVGSLTLISTTPGPDPRLPPPTAEVMAFVSRPPDPDRAPVDQVVDFCRVLAGRRFPFDEEYYRALAAADLERGTNLASRQGTIPVSAASRMDELAGVHVPTCVVHGTEDPLFPYEHAQVMARTIPAAVLVPWKRVGHELPAPLVPDLTEVILRQVRAGA